MESGRFVFPSERDDIIEKKIVIEETNYISEKRDNDYVQQSTPLFTPTKYEDSKEIVENLLSKRSVIVSIDSLLGSEEGKQVAIRLIDFMCGATYALQGKVSKINKFTFYFSAKR